MVSHQVGKTKLAVFGVDLVVFTLKPQEQTGLRNTVKIDVVFAYKLVNLGVFIAPEILVFIGVFAAVFKRLGFFSNLIG